MRGSVRAVGAALVAVLVVSLTGGCGQPARHVVADAVVSTPTPTPTPAPLPTVEKTTPFDPGSIDLAGQVVKSKLYKAGKIPAVRCVLPRPNLTTKAGMLTYAKAFVACMNKAWAPVVTRSDAVLFPPEVFAYSLRKPSATPECEDPPADVDAFYFQSGNSGKICFEFGEFLDAEDQVWNLIDFEQLLAHEYGHHVQQSVGILTLYRYLGVGKSESGQLEIQRRKELQASCLGAAFLGANQRTFRLTGERLDIWEDIVRHVGDEYNDAKIRDHGSRKNHGYWTLRAFDAASPSACNTFAAPAKRVS
jgi:predicted metalloprotease